MGRHKTYDRDAVLDKAMSLFWRLGYEGAHLSDLVSTTELNRFSLYKEFGGKAGLYEAALERFLSYLMDQYRECLTPQPQGMANIAASFAALEYGSQYYGCFMINTLTQRDSVPERAYGLALAASVEVEALYRANLEGARQRGEVEAGLDLATTAKLLQTLDQGLHIQGLAGGSDAQKDAMVAAVLAGLRGPQ